MKRPVLKDKPPSPPTAEEEIARLAALPDVEYEKVRKAEAAKLGFRKSALDKAVDAKRASSSSTMLQGKSFIPIDPEPWAKAVDAKRLLDDLGDIVERYVFLPVEAAVAVVLWIVQTYLMDIATHAPMLLATSPEPNCGKTTLLGVLKRLSWRAMAASNISQSALFRALEKWNLALLIDEAEAGLKDNEALRGLLDSGHSRDAAFVLRSEGTELEPRAFSTWGAKALAQLGQPHPTLISRSIPVTMERRTASEADKLHSLRDADPGEFENLRRRCLRFALDNKDALQAARPKMPPGLQNRDADNWHLLLAIADFAGKEWQEQARTAAVALTNPTTAAATTVGHELLADLRDIFEEHESEESFSATELIEYLCKDPNRPWTTFSHGKEITAHRLARLLKPYGIEPARRKYYVADFASVFKRYLTKKSAR